MEDLLFALGSVNNVSLLVFARRFFSVNNLPTIMSKKTEKAMGQRTYMSKLDIQRVRILYNCGVFVYQTCFFFIVLHLIVQ